MKKLLHIIATPRGEESSTLSVSGVFLDNFRKSHADWVVEELDLSKEELPSLTAKRVDGKYVLLSGKDLYGDLKESWQDIVAEIERFLSADAILISTPMWNFSIPYTLKHYIDVITQPKYLFRYTANGVEGLAKGRKMVVITSRGGDYSSEEGRKADFQEPYLRFVFGFVGVTDITFINAEPMNMGEEPQKKAIACMQEKARKLAPQI
jgi:FMN-dependent NADH-azoreductase